MNITIDQAEAFDAVVKYGTIQKAAKSLHKGHSAVMYLIKSLEDQTQLKLFDRSGYRNQMTLEGEMVLKYCRQLMLTRSELEQVCLKLRNGWEPSLKLIYDGVVDFNIIGDALFKLNESQVPTEVKVLAAYLHEVEKKFEEEKADMMVTILPLKQAEISFIKLKPIRMLLVAHRVHALTHRYKHKKITLADLRRHTFIKITGTPGQLGFSTEQLEFGSTFLVNDFATKKQAVLKGLGYGWLPEYLLESELKDKSVQIIKSEIDNEYLLSPRLYHRKEEAIGKTAKQLLNYFRQG